MKDLLIGGWGGMLLTALLFQKRVDDLPLFGVFVAASFMYLLFRSGSHR